MQIQYEASKRALIVALTGEIDHHSAAQCRSEIDSEFRRSKAKTIIFDLKKLNFMDSSGIGLIMGRYKLASTVNGGVVLCEINSRFDKLFAISGIYRMASKEKSVKDALRKI